MGLIFACVFFFFQIRIYYNFKKIENFQIIEFMP
jgi:hypothetical protein